MPWLVFQKFPAPTSSVTSPTAASVTDPVGTDVRMPVSTVPSRPQMLRYWTVPPVGGGMLIRKSAF
jgi:hypothetical protein